MTQVGPVAGATPMHSPVMIPVGRVKTFGPFGPKYVVGEPVRKLQNGDWLVEVTIVDSGEKAEYRLNDIIEDPEAP